MSNHTQQDSTPSASSDRTAATRRGVLAGAGLAGLAGAISACGLGGSGGSSGSAYGGGSGASSSQPGASSGGGATGAASGSAGGGSASGGSAGALATTSEIPVGGGKVITAKKVVITQPEAGTYKAFSAVCTHQQCTVDQVANGTISCPCHGSTFSAKDGSVTGGPAPSPLPAENIKVSGNEITLG